MCKSFLQIGIVLMKREIADQIEDQIKLNRLEEAIHLFQSNVSDGYVEGELISLSNRWHSLQKEQRMNVISSEDGNLEKRKIVDALVSLLSQVRSSGNGSKPTTGLKNKYLILGGTLLALTLGIYFFKSNATEPVTDWKNSFQVVRDFKEGKAAVYKEKWGFVDTNGKILIPLRFDEAADFDQGKARVKDGAHYFYINESGICVEDCKENKADNNGMNVQFEGNNNQAIDARGGTVIFNEEDDKE